MISVYNDADLLAVYKQRKKILGVFWAITLAYLLICLACLAYHISLPYKDPGLKAPKWTVYLLTPVYFAIIFPYMAIKFSRVNRYYKMMCDISLGLKNEEKNYFYCFEERSLQKNNIDVVACIFETWSKKKKEWMEREVYFDPEKPLPDFKSGDYVRYVCQSNFIIQYEILQRQALEFEEEDEFEDDATEETVEGEIEKVSENTENE